MCHSTRDGEKTSKNQSNIFSVHLFEWIFFSKGEKRVKIKLPIWKKEEKIFVIYSDFIFYLFLLILRM